MTDILKRVRSGLIGRNEVMEQLYLDRSLVAKVKRYIISNGGSKDQADSIRIDAIVAFIQRCYHDQFELKGNVEAYILTTAKNNWIRKQNLQKREREMVLQEGRGLFELEYFSKEVKSQLSRVIAALDEKCRNLMLMWAQNMRMREIAIRMNYKSEGMARKKKYECMQRLKNLFEQYEERHG